MICYNTQLIRVFYTWQSTFQASPIRSFSLLSYLLFFNFHTTTTTTTTSTSFCSSSFNITPPFFAVLFQLLSFFFFISVSFILFDLAHICLRCSTIIRFDDNFFFFYNNNNVRGLFSPPALEEKDNIIIRSLKKAYE